MTTKKSVPQPLPSRMHFTEFLMTCGEDLDPMLKAGFKVFAGKKDWMYEKEWKDKLMEYLGKDKK